MSRFVAGLLLGLIVASGAAWVIGRRGDACQGRCGEGTECQEGQCRPRLVAAAAPAPTDKKARSRRSSGTGGTGAGAAAELQLRPGDDQPATAGDALGRPDTIDLTRSGDEGRELTDAEMERVFAPARASITSCITRAVGDYPLEAGHIEVGLGIERDGHVGKVRLTAPALLLRQGLYRCVRPIAAALRFPPSGGASVVTFPFDLK